MFYSAQDQGPVPRGTPMPEVFDWPLQQRTTALRLRQIEERPDGPLDIGGLLSTYTPKQLQALAKTVGVSAEGSRSELIDRLIKAQAEQIKGPDILERTLSQCLMYWSSPRAYLEELAREKAPDHAELERIRHMKAEGLDGGALESLRALRLDLARVRGARQTMDDRKKLLRHCAEFGVETHARPIPELIDELLVKAGYEMPPAQAEASLAPIADDEEKLEKAVDTDYAYDENSKKWVKRGVE